MQLNHVYNCGIRKLKETAMEIVDANQPVAEHNSFYDVFFKRCLLFIYRGTIIPTGGLQALWVLQHCGAISLKMLQLLRFCVVWGSALL
jgi:hypothetical protein